VDHDEEMRRYTEDVDRYLASLMGQYRREAGASATGEGLEQWVKARGGPESFPPAIQEAMFHLYCHDLAEEVDHEDPNLLKVRVLKPSGEEGVICCDRDKADPAFIAEAERQAREDWEGDCPAYDAWMKRKEP
jgi:hypothetical protein